MLAAPTALPAQGARDSLISGLRAYERADFEAAARLISAGLDPAAGPADSVWVLGLHRLTDALLQQAGDSLAMLWLRWAHRLDRSFLIDSLTFPPNVTNLIAQARARMAGAALDDTALVETAWRWGGAADRGALRVERGPTGPYLAVIAGVGTVLPGETRTLPAGVYQVRFSPETGLPYEITREVLPGVTTTVRPRQRRLVAAPAALGGAPLGAGVAAPVTLSAGGAATCSVTASAATFCWGDNRLGRLGAGTADTLRNPALVSGAQAFASVSMGPAHACALTAAGTAFCWGAGQSGQLGNGATQASNVPVAVSGSNAFQAIAAGASHTCAIAASGAAFCWGAGPLGQLGGRAATSPVPVPVTMPPGVTFRALASGANHTCALTTQGAAFCWGANTQGQLGNGATTNANAPQAVAGGLVFRAIAAGSAHTCALTAQGAAHCWGSNAGGQLGSPVAGGSPRPAAVSDSLAFTALAAGDGHTCALTQSGAAYCWGEGRAGQLGNGQSSDSPRPVLVVGGRDFQSLALGSSHSCGRTADAVLWCWGDNSARALGASAARTSATPVPVLARPPARLTTGAAPVSGWAAARSPVPFRLERVWAARTGELFAVGERGTILRSTDGTSWVPTPSGSSLALWTVWGASAGDVFAAGEGGTVLRWTGTSWSASRTGEAGEAIYELWGADAGCVYGVGRRGLITKFDGQRWRTLQSGTTQDLWGVWGASCTDIFAVGAGGTVVRFTGTAWQAMPSGSTQLLEAVWGSSAANVIAVGDNGTILRLVGGRWTPAPGIPAQSILGVWGASATEVYAVGTGGTILRFDGTAWSAMSSGTSQSLWGIAGAAGGAVAAVGDAGTVRRATRVSRAAASVRESFDVGTFMPGASWQVDSAAPGVLRVETTGDGELHVLRSGSRGVMGALGITQSVRVPVQPGTALQFDAMVGSSGVPDGCGLSCAAYPAMVRLLVRNKDQTESEVWYALNDDGGRSASLGPLTVVARGDAPTGQWQRSRRFVIRDALLRADTVLMISLGGIGTDFEAWFDNVMLPAPMPSAIVVSPDSATLAQAGAMLQLSAEARDTAGTALPWVTITWATSDTAVARVSATGLVTAVASGTARITATGAALSAAATITVRIPPARRGRPTRRP